MNTWDKIELENAIENQTREITSAIRASRPEPPSEPFFKPETRIKIIAVLCVFFFLVGIIGRILY